MNENEESAQEFVTLMTAQKEFLTGGFERIEIPPMSKKEAREYSLIQTSFLLLKIIFLPLIFFGYFIIFWGAHGGTFFRAFIWSFKTVFVSLWNTGYKKPSYELKRAYGIIKEPVYKTVAKNSHPLINSNDEIISKTLEIIK